MCRAGIRGPGGGVRPVENVAAGGANAEDESPPADDEASDNQEMEFDLDDTDICFALLAFLF